MPTFDYVILGAGSAGCVLANRLSENPANQVLLVEAGGAAWNPYLYVPKIGARLHASDRYAWRYRTLPFGPNNTTEVWPRGRVVGGSSAINGLVYNRGSRDDYDDLERLGNEGWGWDWMVPVYKRLEDNEFGPSATRGVGGHSRSARRATSTCCATRSSARARGPDSGTSTTSTSTTVSASASRRRPSATGGG